MKIRLLIFFGLLITFAGVKRKVNKTVTNMSGFYSNLYKNCDFIRVN